MKKKIAIMFTLILAAGTFTACTAEEKANNDIRTSVVSKTADVSVSETTFVSNTTSKIETTVTAETTVNPTVSQETKSLKKRIPNPKKKPTVGKIRRLFRQLNQLKQSKVQYQKIRSRKPKQPKKNLLKKQQRNRPKR